ncbi:MAG: DNA polymerase/3'-5' exonuclease PolX [Bacteroidetes bacterium]|nr:DNA polymerase/3'-5' exonuclease PolX [Bacteroidota bacterium]
MDNKQVAEILEQIGTLLDLKGENPFKCRAYHNASRIVAALTTDVKQLAETGELREVKGIGEGLAEKIDELIKTGKLGYYEELKKSLPPGLVEMLRVPGLGPKRIKILYEKLNITTIEKLKEAAEKKQLEELEGFGEKIEENILRGIELVKKHADKFLYPVAKEAADRIVSELKNLKAINRIEVAGSLRRRKEIIGDIDILTSAKSSDTDKIMKAFTSHPDVAKVTATGETKSSVVLKSGINCDLRVVSDDEFPFALSYFTGSKEHNVEMRSISKKFGLSLNEYGFSELGEEEKRGKAKRKIKCSDEADIFKTLGLLYVPPELRENMGEIEAASQNKMPDLIEEKDIRGTFHCHTNYSDGVNTLEEMAKTAQILGWEYLGIAEHSKSAAYAGGLSVDKLKKQIKEIDLLNLKFKNFRIFKGIEVDILTDGSLDYDSKTLRSFDFVIVAIHSKFGMSEKDMTRRIIRGMKNKAVTMLAHPTGRLLLEREAYPVNMPEVIKAAADFGVTIEINAHPLRLDLDWRLCKFAKGKGVKIAINPDAHNTKELIYVDYGVGIARKGWLEAKDVINTMGLNEMEKWLAKR